MRPQVSVITGPSKGAVIEIDGSFTVGRDKGNTLRIKQLSVSRQHCVIETEGDRHKLTDTSTYGTFVNHVPVKERYLEHGDEIRVGESLLVFLQHEDRSDPDLNTTKLNQTGVVTLSAFSLRREDLFAPRHGERAGAPRPTREVSTLLKISALLGNERERASLYCHLLEALLEHVPAECAAVLRVGHESAEYAVLAGRDRGGAESAPAHVSRPALEQVVREGVAVLSHEVVEAAGGAPDATTGPHTRYSLLCAPLAKEGEAEEVIYLLSAGGGGRFAEEHLELLTAVAVVASIALGKLAVVESLEAENSRLRREAAGERPMIGESPAMREVDRLIGKVAPADSTVLVLGESGTGKELAAYAIHTRSPRADKPFAAVNCAALVEALLDSELFGHEKGAFTGAYTQKKGKLESADGGTFFLDEVGDMSPALQAKLLRVIQERVVERVGGRRPIKVDVRLIAATNKDLAAAVRQGTFREDLYYRLSVVELLMPPLRERRADIPLLANYFAAKYGERCKRRVLGLSPEARECLLRHNWPGNVRELQNAVERAVVLGSTELIQPEDLPHHLSGSPRTAPQPRVLSFKTRARQAKREIVCAAIEEANGSIAGAARLLDMQPPNLHRLIRTLGLKLKLDE